jgi:hypothetical protein
MPDFVIIVTDTTGKKCLLEGTLVETRVEFQDKKVKEEDEPVGTAPAHLEVVTTTERMCQTVATYQPQKRDILVYNCVLWEAVQESHFWRNVLIGIGIVGAVVLTAGLAAWAAPGVILAVVGPLGAGAATTGGIAATGVTLMGVGGGVATVGFGGASLIPVSDNPADFAKGAQIGTEQQLKFKDWVNSGQEFRRVIGTPHPCNH